MFFDTTGGIMQRRTVLHACVIFSLLPCICFAQVCNVKVVTDASPDCYDLDSFIHSATGGWQTPEEKCWALFYWVHIARRQTSPMIFHGVEVTDPIRQFNDFGYTMCSTVAGINCGLWHHMGFPVRFWDVTLHTVSECFYNDRWHMYDNSMSAIYTLCDGRTVAGVVDLGGKGACEASNNREEFGHVVKYHCLTATSSNGFLTGADCPRDLAQEAHCFNPAGLKLRTYYNNWDWGHRYVLNLYPGASYTRYYRSLGKEKEYFVPNQGKDPESINPRYRIRGNGVWQFRPNLTPTSFPEVVYECVNALATPQGIVRSARFGEVSHVIFKVQGANIVTSQLIRAKAFRKTSDDWIAISVSTTAGRTWQRVYESSSVGESQINCCLIDEVNGSDAVLVRFSFLAAKNVEDVAVSDIEIETRTMLNSKTQPQLRLGQNTVFVDVGEPTDTVMIWPDLQGENYRNYVAAEKNIATEATHKGWHGVMFAEKPGEEAFTIYRVVTPRPIKRVVYGGRFYNRVPNGQISLFHSFDGGATWELDWQLTETSQPWDVIHYVTLTSIPADAREVLLKYSLQAPQAGPMACSIYSVRMEVQHENSGPAFRPLDVTFTWDEIQSDRTRVRRSHRQRVDSVPMRYTIDVGGVDHPVVDSLRVALVEDQSGVPYGYSDDSPGLGSRVSDVWQECGRNLLQGKPYTLTVEPTGAWGADDPQRQKLTDGVVGPNYAGGITMKYAVGFDEKSGPVDITVDMEELNTIAAVGIQLTAGWPWWDALKGEIRDTIEVFVSRDGQRFESCGTIPLNLFRREIPINHMLPDDETAQGWNYVFPLDSPVVARFVRYRVAPRRSLGITEVQAFDRLERRDFSLRVLLPDERR
jgi:hypothetical protein